MEQLTRKERLVLGLIPAGHRQAIHKHRLARLAGLDEREAREIIYHLVVEHGLPIGSSTEPGTGGYFIIENTEDMEIATRHLKPRAVKIIKRARALEKIARHRFNQQLKLVLEE
ncbi:DNA replication protein [Desulfolucanica intricata]|uniref:DNA replication protein n=1 Tax=Desulfolucanica intricata TaxID=1285191 RepID=UPI00083798D2|nr:DNA replication protein [Desulfolucanica intricata]